MKSGCISIYLQQWFSKPLKKMPDDIRSFVASNFPDWQELTPTQRRVKAEQKGAQLSTKWRLKIERAGRQDAVFKESREGKAAICIGWYNDQLNASMWFGLSAVNPVEASKLLCRIDPLSSDDPELVFVDDDRSSPERFLALKRKFLDESESEGKPRTLTQWLDIAKQNGLKYHSWIDEYIAAVETTKGAQESPRFQPSTVGDSSQLEEDRPLVEKQTAQATIRPLSITTHRVERRKNNLTAVIEMAKANAADQDDPHSNWAAFVTLAQSNSRPNPLLGYADGEGVKYQGENDIEFLNKKNFLRRVRRTSAIKRR